MKQYKDVQDYCNQKIRKDYHSIVIGYGEHSRTDVIDWVKETFTDSESIIKRDFPEDVVWEHCNHSWKTYDSGFTKYEYCQYCDERNSRVQE